MAAITQKKWLDFLHLLHNKLRNGIGIKLTGMSALTEINNFILFRFLDDSEKFGLNIPDELKFKHVYEKYATKEKINEDQKIPYIKDRNCFKLWTHVYDLDDEKTCLLKLYYANDMLRGYLTSSVNFVSIYIKKYEASPTIQDIICTIYEEFKDITFDTNFFDMFGSAYEEFKTNACGNSGKSTGQHFTNVFIKRIIINELKPKYNEIFYEPCAGSGGFIHTADHYVYDQEKDIEKSKIFKKNIYANECNPEIFRPLIMNMLFHNIPIANIKEKDSLSPGNIDYMKNKCNVIATNYPFGMNNEIKLNDGYWDILKSGKNYVKNSSAQFIVHIYHSLVEGGRSGFVSDRGILNNGTSKATSWETKVRKFMFENNNVYKIIYLPQGAFTYTNFQTCIIFLIKGVATQEVKIYDAKFKDPKDKNSEIYVDNNPVGVFKIEDLRENNYSINTVKKEEIKEGYIKLGNIVNFESGDLLAVDKIIPGQYPVIGGGIKFMEKKHNNFNCDENTIIMSTRGSYAGFINKFKVKIFVTNNCKKFKIIDNNEYDNNFIYYCLKIKYQYKLIDDENNGGCQIRQAQPQINMNKIFDIQIPQITLEHQQEIATLLDDLFQNYNIELLQEYTKTIDIFKLLVHKKYEEFKIVITNIYNYIESLRYMEVLKNTKKNYFNTQIKIIETQNIILNDMIKINIGKTPSRNDNEMFKGKYLWCKCGDLTNDVINDTEEKITDEAIIKYSMKLIEKGSVLVSFKLSIGKVGIASTDMYCNEAIMFFKHPNNITNEYLKYYFEYVNFYEGLLSGNIGSGSLNKEKLLNLLIPIPNIEDQTILINNINNMNSFIYQALLNNQFLKTNLDNMNNYISKVIINNNININNINNINNDNNDNNNDVVNDVVNTNDDNNENDGNNKKNNKKVNKKIANKKTTKKPQINTPLQEISNLEIPKSIKDIKTKKDKKYNIPYFTATKKYYCQEATYTGPHILCTRVTQNQGTLSLVDGDFSASSDFIIIELKEEYTQYYEQVIEYIKNNFDYNKLIDEDPVLNTKNERTNNIGVKHLKNFVINF